MGGEYHTENSKIPFDENEANKSIIASKTIVQNANGHFEPNTSNKIEQIAIKQKESAINQTTFYHQI